MRDEDISFQIMQIFDREYEYAPENEYIKSFYSIDENESDYYKVRYLIDTIFFNTYLFFTDTSLKLEKLEEELIERNNDERLHLYLEDNRDNFLHEKCTRLLSLKGKEWTALILGDKHPLKKDLLNISQKIRGYFLYKGQDEFDIFLEHIASGKKFKLTKKSYEHYSDFKEIDTIIFIGIVNWKNEWWFSGVSFQEKFNADLILDEKNSLQSRMEVNFLDHNNEKTNKLLKSQLDAFLSFNNGSPIAFLQSDEIDKFYKKYIEFFNKSLNLSKKGKKQSLKMAKTDGFWGDNNNKNDFLEISDTGLFFFNPKSGGEIALDINSAFPLSNNHFYNIEESEDDVLHLLVSEDFSTELTLFCIDNCKTNLPFFNKGVGKKYLEDIDFLLRFWKTENYHTKPSITYTGKKK